MDIFIYVATMSVTIKRMIVKKSKYQYDTVMKLKRKNCLWMLRDIMNKLLVMIRIHSNQTEIYCLCSKGLY